MRRRTSCCVARSRSKSTTVRRRTETKRFASLARRCGLWARVLDANFDQGWLALEFVALGSIRDRLATNAAAELLALARWAVPLARAIARVHRAGLVHADIKPANILLRSVEEPILSDFGICAARGTPSLGRSAGYLSPERLAGQVLDPDDDIYAYGRVIDDVVAQKGRPRNRTSHGERWQTDACSPEGSDLPMAISSRTWSRDWSKDRRQSDPRGEGCSRSSCPGDLRKLREMLVPRQKR